MKPWERNWEVEEEEVSSSSPSSKNELNPWERDWTEPKRLFDNVPEDVGIVVDSLPNHPLVQWQLHGVDWSAEKLQNMVEVFGWDGAVEFIKNARQELPIERGGFMGTAANIVSEVGNPVNLASRPVQAAWDFGAYQPTENILSVVSPSAKEFFEDNWLLGRSWNMVEGAVPTYLTEKIARSFMKEGDGVVSDPEKVISLAQDYLMKKEEHTRLSNNFYEDELNYLKVKDVLQSEDAPAVLRAQEKMLSSKKEIDDFLSSSLKTRDGTDSGISFKDYQEADETVSLMLELWEEKGKVDLSTAAQLQHFPRTYTDLEGTKHSYIHNPKTLERLGIKIRDDESVSDWFSKHKTINSIMKKLGLKEGDLIGKRAQAVEKHMEKSLEAFKNADKIPEDIKVKFLEAIDATKKGLDGDTQQRKDHFEVASAITRDIERMLKGADVPQEVKNEIYGINRQIKSMRKLTQNLDPVVKASTLADLVILGGGLALDYHLGGFGSGSALTAAAVAAKRLGPRIMSEVADKKAGQDLREVKSYLSGIDPKAAIEMTVTKPNLFWDKDKSLSSILPRSMYQSTRELTQLYNGLTL